MPAWADPPVLRENEVCPHGLPRPLKTRRFYGKTQPDRNRWIIPETAADSDLEVDDETIEEAIDDDILDPDFILELADDDELTPTSLGAVTRVRPQNMPEIDSDENEADETTPEEAAPPRKRTKTAKERTWNKENINILPLPPFAHTAPSQTLSPIEYFQTLFSVDLLDDIVFQTNLYARQKNVNTNFLTDKHEMMVFIGIVLYMGVVSLPAIEDYWATYTRVPQVADFMSSKRFRLIRSLLHFNNNEMSTNTTDRFFKIRPVFAAITKQFLKVQTTPTQSIDEVMVAYKGTRSGNLRQYIQNKPDKWGYKLFCRGSIDGFIHDIIMYQGESTFLNHHTQLTPEESELLFSTKTVLLLAKTLKNPSRSAIYADNYFTSLDLVERLRDSMGCRYVGTARTNRVGHAPLKGIKDMEKKNVPSGEYDYCSVNGVLALRWKDNKVVTVLSSDAGIEPMQTIKRYDRTAKKKVDVTCPNVIKQYNGKMGGIDKSDMLTHLYKTPMRARRWYIKLFGYSLDLCVCNAWVVYKRDCKALESKAMSLKTFRMDISHFAKCQKFTEGRVIRTPSHTDEPSIVSPGLRTVLPHVSKRYDSRKWHMPTYVKSRQTCKYCSTKKEEHRSRWICDVCQVALCLYESRNCFKNFHTPPTEAVSCSPQSGPSQLNKPP